VTAEEAITVNATRATTWLVLPLVLPFCAFVCLAEEPVIGGPCDGCELVFEDMPAQLEAHSRIAPVGELGQPLVIEGIVRTLDGKPASDIVVYAYQTDDTGVYPDGTTRHGRLRGWALTDEKGSYRFDTIRPGAYPTRDNPQHVHMHVIEPGKGAYYLDDLIFDDDPLLTKDRRKSMQRGRGGHGLAYPEKDDRGVWHVRRDITLGKNIPDYD